MALSEITNYLEDDWDDNNLTGRSSTSEGYFLHPSDGLLASGEMEAGDALKGVYRPEWTTDNGSPSATNNQLEIPAGNSTGQHLSTPSKWDTGSFECDWTHSGSSLSNSHKMEFFLIDATDLRSANDAGNDNYMILASGGGTNFDLQKRVGGSVTELIGNTWGGNTSTHTAKATRDSYGGFELFLDSSSQGTVTDTSHTESNYIGFGSNLDGEVDIDNLVVK